MQKNIQHGDVSLHAIAKPEIELEEITHNGIYILREGEVTGHQHRIITKEREGFKIYKDEKGNLYVNSFGAEIDHYDSIGQKQAEHETKPVEQGWYIVKQERSWNPILAEIEETKD